MPEAAAKSHMPKSTLQNRINNFKADPKARTRRVGRILNLEKPKYNVLIELLKDFGDTGYLLKHVDFFDAVEELYGLINV